MKKQIFLILTILGLSLQNSYACELKDYDCMKSKKFAEYYTNHEKEYVINQKIYVQGYADGSALKLDSREGNYAVNNVKIIANGYRAISPDERTSILEVNNFTNDKDAITLNNVSIDLINGNSLIGSQQYLSDDYCIAAYCQYGNVEINNIATSNYGWLNIDIR